MSNVTNVIMGITVITLPSCFVLGYHYMWKNKTRWEHTNAMQNVCVCSVCMYVRTAEWLEQQCSDHATRVRIPLTLIFQECEFLI